MKKIHILLMLIPLGFYAQVGINTATPNAMLDIRSSNEAAPTNSDGIIIPKMNAFPNPTPTTAQAGMMAYLSTTLGTYLPGFYYWTGNYWRSIAGNTSWDLNGNSPLFDAVIGTNNSRAVRFIANGYISGLISPTVSSNTLYGFSSFSYSTTGGENAAFGYRALGTTTTGFANTAVGYRSMLSNTTGNRNVAVGHTALLNNQTGSENHAIGWNALALNTGGWYNISIGSLSLRQNTTGSFNVGNGYRTLWTMVSGQFNSAYGNDSGYFIGAAMNNTTCIGASSGFATTVSNHVNIGNTSNVWIGGQVNWATFSDVRAKKNISEDVSGLDFIRKLRPVTYNFDYKKEFELLNPGQEDPMGEFKEKYDIEKIKFSGFIAQEVEAAARETGYDFSGVVPPPNGKGAYTLRYAEFVVPLVKAIQEQQAYIEKLEARLERLEKQR